MKQSILRGKIEKEVLKAERQHMTRFWLISRNDKSTEYTKSISLSLYFWVYDVSTVKTFDIRNFQTSPLHENMSKFVKLLIVFQNCRHDSKQASKALPFKYNCVL